MKKRQIIASIVLAMFILSTIAFSSGATEMIEVYRNYVNIEVNGKKINADSFLYDSTTYVPLRALTEALGAKVGWNQDTKTSSVTLMSENSSSSSSIDYPEKVDATSPILNSIKLGLDTSFIDAYKLEKSGKKVEIELSYNDDAIELQHKAFLDYNTQYTLKLYMEDGGRKVVNFQTGGLPKLELGYLKKVIFVPAMPEKGFNYPYYLVLPNKTNVQRNAGKKNYLFVEPHNTGRVGDDLSFHIQEAMTIATGNSAVIADELGLPRIVPIIVRPDSMIGNEYVYTHDLSRNTIILEKLKKLYPDYNEVFEPMDRVDLQVVGMIEHANSYLEENGWKMEKKVFMWGFSASGDFVNRFTFLHPHMVKAANFGGFPVLPVAKVGSTDMIYPLGTYDYKSITGRDFDLEAYNNVAKLGYIGSDDNNNPQLNDDMWTQPEKDIINKVLAVKEYPDRWEKSSKIFKDAGGQAQLNVYIGAKHEVFYKGMGEDYKNFYMANRESDKPVYVKPSDPDSTISEILSDNIVTVKEDPFSYDKTTIIEAFWSGTTPKTITGEFADYVKSSDAGKYFNDLFFIVIAEWNSSKDSDQMNERLDKIGKNLTLKADGFKDIEVELVGSMSNGNGSQLYWASVRNVNDMKSDVKYSIYDSKGNWIIADGVYVLRKSK